ncbi:Predicted dienelactone hydrolase [Pannonibacter phragmitetus]|uniref:Predicted dienelactone hydrolase n=2 Tax=Pannonibacter phragmitetus TaxID=121719 RepID=A0A378ZXE2_9HYPH|nr:Predicted dienelactone hydrolase [Pannonibacter phragmitetus]
MKIRHLLAVAPLLLSLAVPPGTAMADNRIDTIRPDAPVLAAYGSYGVGVTTVELTNPGQIDVLKSEPGKEPVLYDRPLTVEVFYPAAAGAKPVPLEAMMRDGSTMIELNGRSSRAAEPDRSGAPYPLVIISHGYPGNRFLMSPLAENLASKGYVVASIDHTESTYDNRAAFISTLVNRPLDQMFVLNAMEEQGKTPGGPLEGLLSTERTGLIGYSMGGYGTLISGGAGLADFAREASWADGKGAFLERHLAGSESHEALVDPRLKAIVSVGPWARKSNAMNADGLAGLRVPALIVGGNQDEISGYSDGIRKIWQEAKGTDRYLLTFVNAGHNAAAPMPAPAESYAYSEAIGFPPFQHYADPVWDSVRMNNILQHFTTAFLSINLKSKTDEGKYLKLLPYAEDGVWSMNADGKPNADHTYWEGFPQGSAIGLRFEHLEKGK